MVLGCSVPDCKNNAISNPDIVYFRLPAHEPQKTIWLQRLFGNVNSEQHNDVLVCSTHFTNNDFVNYQKDENSGPQNILMESAIPSVNLPNFAGATTTNTIVMGNQTNTQVTPLGIIIYQYNVQGSNIPTPALQPISVPIPIQPKILPAKPSQTSAKDEIVKVFEQVKLRDKLRSQIKFKLMSIKAELNAENKKCNLLQRKMAELRNKAKELQKSALEMEQEPLEDEEDDDMLSDLSSKSLLEEALKSGKSSGKRSSDFKDSVGSKGF